MMIPQFYFTADGRNKWHTIFICLIPFIPEISDTVIKK
jgi:hypothetical protein